MDMKRIVRGLALALALAAAAGGGALAAGEAVLRTAPENDFRTDQQYSYLTDPDVGNVFAYAWGAEQLSRPEGIVCDFSGDGIGEAEYPYISQLLREHTAPETLVQTACDKCTLFHGGRSRDDVTVIAARITSRFRSEYTKTPITESTQCNEILSAPAKAL